jgi:prepilin-type processing-associated H-X9-DG protein
MPVHFVCPHCRAETIVADRFSGQSGPCAQCGQTILIPAIPAMAGDPAYRPQSSTKIVLIILGVVGLVVVMFIGLMVALLVPAVSAAREAAKRAQCANNLKQISLAMTNYQETYGCFPPAYIADKDGKPMHSWRVLLLPYLEQQQFYDQYRFDEPWDSLNNKKITDLAMRVFQCPDQSDPTKPTTGYVMIVGPHTLSNGPNSRKVSDITDGVSNTIMLVEVPDSDIPWAEPRDLDFKQLDFKINSGKRPCIGSNHPRGAYVSFCDGSVHFLNDSIDPQIVKAMATIDDGEKVPARDFD